MTKRIIRGFIGLGLIGYGIYSANTWFYLGAIPLLTAIINWCPLESKIGGCDPESGCCSTGDCETTPAPKKESIVTSVSKPTTPTFSAGSFSAEKPTKIEILGTGCTKCVALEKVVQEVIATLDAKFEVLKVEDIGEIMTYNVVSTPALVINGEVKSTGKLLTQEEVRALLV